MFFRRMSSRRITILVVILVASFSIVVMGIGRSPLSPTGLWRGSSSAVSVQDALQALVNQSVNGDRLLQDVEQLATSRYSDVERQQTRQYLMQQLQEAGWHPEERPFASQESELQEDGVTAGVNILAVQPGRDPDAGTIVVGAHYDSVARSPGADDNASGVAVVLELARLLANTPASHPLAIALFDLEEAGLVGSKAFTQSLPQNMTIDGAIILEMMGYACRQAGCQTYPQGLPIAPPSDVGDFLAIVGDLGHPSLVDAFKHTTVDSARLPVFTLQIPTLGDMTPDLLRSDHVSFWRKGVGAVMVTDTANFRNPHYHQPSDTPDTLDAQFLVDSATVVLGAIAQLIY